MILNQVVFSDPFPQFTTRAPSPHFKPRWQKKTENSSEKMDCAVNDVFELRNYLFLVIFV
jgi:hypothetical protein